MSDGGGNELVIIDGLAGEIGISWPDKTDAAGNPKATYRNTLVALRNLGAKFSFDEFRQRALIEWDNVGPGARELSDRICSRLRNGVIGKFLFDPRPENVAQAASSLCEDNVFDPVRDYLTSVKWDGKLRLETWLHDYLSAEDTPLNRAIGQKMLIAACRRVLDPGCKFDTIVVFEGPQGKGKSTALLYLAGERDLFSDQDILHLDSKGQQEALAGKWICELSELGGLSKSDTEKTKAFASRTHDRARAAYARFSADQPRRCILVGTTNENEYLTDSTGNRRFWPVRCGDVDLPGLKAVRDQLWAEAMVGALDDGETLTLPESLWGDAAAEQTARLQSDPWEDILAKVPAQNISGRPCWATADLIIALEIPRDRQHAGTTRRIANIMRKLGREGPIDIRRGPSTTFRGYR